ncbi:Otoancorin [Exaiptasia diaphana]|nr:Otoancorin [Exaiptasia diaphana]
MSFSDDNHKFTAENLEKKLKDTGIGADLQSRILKGGSTTFEKVDKETMSKLPPSVLASVGKDAIRGMNDQQLQGMVKGSMKRGTSSKDIQKLLENVDSNQFKTVLSFVKNSTTKLSKKQMEAFKNQMKKTKGDPSTWSASTVKEMGGMIVGLSPNEIKKLASAGKETFEASLDELAKTDVNTLTKGQRRQIIKGAEESFGEKSKWTSSTIKKMSKFVGDMKHKDLAEIPVSAIKGAVLTLGKTKLKGKSSREMMNKLKDPKNGFGASDKWTSETLRSLGNLTTGLTGKDIEHLDRHAVQGALKPLGSVQFSLKQARKMASKVKEAYGSVNKWTAEVIRNASNILTGLKPKELSQLPKEAVMDSVEKLKRVKFSQTQPSKWNESIAEQMGPFIGGLPLSDLKNMPKAAIKSALKAMKGDDTVPPAKRRAILKKAREAGDLKLKEVGSFLKTFSLKDLESVDPIVDLGLNDTDDGNGTEDTTLTWKLSQARKVLGKIKKTWGDPDSSESQWTLDNIVRLKGLAIGVWKTLIDSRSSHDIADIVEEFSQQEGFTPGQMKMIIKAYKDKLGLNLSKNFTNLDQIEIEALGQFVQELNDTDLANLNVDAGVEAVRQIGVTELHHKPRGLVERKLATGLKLLAKKYNKANLDPKDLKSDDFQDLGNLLLGLSPRQIQQIVSTQFKDAVGTFGQIQGYNKEQLHEMADKAKEAYKGNGNVEDAPSALTGEDVDDMGNVLEGFTQDDFAKMDEHVVQEKIDDLGSLVLDKEQAEGLMQVALTAKRKKRQTDISSKSGDELIAMGSTLLALSTSDIASVDNTAFDDAASSIGSIKGFTLEQLQAWANKAKKAWNSDVALITSDQLLRLGAISVGFSADDLSKMSLTSDDVIESLGSQPVASGDEVGYSADQLSKALSNIKTRKGKAIKDFTGDEITALKNFAIAMTASEVASISSQEFGAAVSTLGGLKGWSEEQLVKLKENCVALYGSISTWDSADIREAGVAIGGFTSSELEYIKDDLLAMISPTAIGSMPPNLFKVSM